MSFGLAEGLTIAGFIAQAASVNRQHDSAVDEIETSNAQRHTQIAIDKGLAVNAIHNLNEQEMLEMKKLGLDSFQLKLTERRKLASLAAKQASAGGVFGKQGGSAEASVANVERHAATAFARKTDNFDVTQRDFQIRRTNVELGLISRINQSASGLQTPPDDFGNFLNIAGLGLNTAANFSKGTQGSQGPQGAL